MEMCREIYDSRSPLEFRRDFHGSCIFGLNVAIGYTVILLRNNYSVIRNIEVMASAMYLLLQYYNKFSAPYIKALRKIGFY